MSQSAADAAADLKVVFSTNSAPTSSLTPEMIAVHFTCFPFQGLWAGICFGTSS